MKKCKTSEDIVVEETPQQSLEKILKSEIQVAQKISEAKENAEKSVISVRDEISLLKEKIIEQARIDREKMIAEGTDSAQAKARDQLETSTAKSDRFYQAGQTFINDAVQEVLDMVLFDEGDGSL